MSGCSVGAGTTTSERTLSSCVGEYHRHVDEVSSSGPAISKIGAPEDPSAKGRFAHPGLVNGLERRATLALTSVRQSEHPRDAPQTVAGRRA